MVINIHEAKTHFSRLVDRAAAGETVVVGRAGKPIAKLTRLDSPDRVQRLGFLKGQAQIPDDFDDWGRDEILDLFEVGE
ncbi:type II toxin-antitoxin system Phd/YefM family antitoxin [Microbacterium sp.]|uniref:type II toxin-antitoxin system Phd/YefM family antitoxin n=1 Tax=Microbacterium sp. TaxID=51671 RepID=UPI002CCE3942|nr:type II toxin-antitoxin system Phd/YefM family antitoxin [Microbacterium sp.]HET6301906.1 type II toxin-antitoxin system Phd/YefM family antitoxin [Microbacterium sp.]HWL77157.1 type II toxin-antitoxin system Phd/YefM family antitoxin [Microbacterium sp.]